MKIILLAVFWIAWCSLHSAMISTGVTTYLKGALGERFRFYRLFFNITALVTLTPLVLYSYSLHGPPLVDWAGIPVLQAALFAVAAALFAAGALRFDGRYFLGLHQIRRWDLHKEASGSGRLDMGGILEIIRHPWYAGGMAFVWAVGNMSLPDLVADVILTLYFVVGAILEERKLVMEFGNEYRAYRSRVSMFFPYKWIKNKITNHP